MNLSGLSRARLSNQHKGLVTHQDFSEALSVLPDGQLQPLLQDLKVAWRVGQVGDGVDLLRNGALPQVTASAACSPEWLHVPVTASIPVTVPLPRPAVTVSVTSARGRCVRRHNISPKCMNTQTTEGTVRIKSRIKGKTGNRVFAHVYSFP